MSEPIEPSSRFSLTDSPWFWVMLFSAFGICLLVAMSPKYSKRQGRLELQYYAREEVARREVEGQREGTSSVADSAAQADSQPPAAGDLIIPLWPLVALLSALLATSAVFLWRAARRQIGRDRIPGGPKP